MGFKCGIVGLPNVGKSTLFNALTQAGIGAENFPFCTVEPNSGIVPVPDSRLSCLTEIVHPKRTVPTNMEFVDIAGLIQGASSGEGLGNKFLSHIRETDAIAHVVRCFENDNIIHVANKVDPIDDIEVVNLELVMADLESCEKHLQRSTRNAKGGDEQAIMQKELLEKLIPQLESGKFVSSFVTEEEMLYINSFNLLTAKPMMYIANVDENGFTDNEYLEQVRELAKKQKAEVVPICNKLESEIVELEDVEREEFLLEMGMKESGLSRVIRAGYHLLGLQTYFTAGVQEVRAWTISKGDMAPQAAAKIHTDFERGFIRAEVISYEHFLEFSGEQGAKEAGKLRVEGKDYIVKDGDIIHFRFNV